MPVIEICPFCNNKIHFPHYRISEGKILKKATEILRKKMKNKAKENKEKKKERKKNIFAHKFILEEVPADLSTFVFDVSCNDYNQAILSSPPRRNFNYINIKKKMNGSCIIANQIFNHFNQSNGSILKMVTTLQLHLAGATDEMINTFNSFGLCSTMDAVMKSAEKNMDIKGFTERNIVLPNAKFLKTLSLCFRS